MEKQTENRTINLLNQDLKLKTLLLIILVLLVIGGGIAGGYWYINRERSKENNTLNTKNETSTSEKPQDNGNNYQMNIKERYIITDLNNGWKLLKNEGCGYSIEFPSNWYIDNLSNSSLLILNKNPQDGPYVGVTTPDDLLSLKIVSMSNELITSKNQEISISGYYPGEDLIVVHGLKEYYENLFSYDIDAYRKKESIDFTKHFPVQEMIVNGYQTKRVYAFGEGILGTVYNFSINNYDDIIKLYFFRKEINLIPEYQDMLDSFKILE